MTIIFVVSKTPEKGVVVTFSYLYLASAIKTNYDQPVQENHEQRQDFQRSDVSSKDTVGGIGCYKAL